MAWLSVIKPGMGSSIQDLGRSGFLNLGVCQVGAADQRLHRLANCLVGNSELAATLEFSIMGPTLVSRDVPVRVAVVGNVNVSVNGNPAKSWSSLNLEPGDELELSSVNQHTFAYLAVEGGFDVPLLFGSRSTHVRAGMGGFYGRTLQAGDDLPFQYAKSGDKALCVAVPMSETQKLMQPCSKYPVVLGPQDDAFDTSEIETFLREKFTVTVETDRMGMRLAGPKLKHRVSADILSDGIAYGSVQVPGSGLPIILLADRQTIGGYTKIATVVSSYLGVLAQLQPGVEIEFHAVSAAQSIELTRHAEAALQSVFKKIAVETVEPDTNILMSKNLISGIVDGKP